LKHIFRRHVSRAALAAALSFAVTATAQAATIEGRVTDAENIAALEGAIVRIDELGLEAVTGRDGVYRFRDVPAGAYSLSVQYIGAQPVSQSVNVGATDAAVQDFALGGQGADRIIVLGQRGSLYSALNQKRTADILSDVLSSDAIGQFPDQNVSEAARRVAGLSVENDQGEGRFVVIRGIDPNLNATNINGVRIPAPEGNERGVALDVIDADALSSIVVTKSTTPNMDGDAIGGTIDVQTLSAFDREGRFFAGTFGGSYNELTERVGPKISLTGSDTFADGRVGVAGAVSWRERTFATENLEVGGDWFEGGGLLWNDEIELRDYVVTRERTNMTLNFDYRPNDSHDFFVRTLFSEFRDHEFRNRVEAKFEEDALDASSTPDLVVFNDDGREIEIDRDLKDREETQQILSFLVGGQSRFDAWTFDYMASWSHSEEDEPSSIDTVNFRAKFEDEGFFLGQNTSNPMFPTLGRGVSNVAPIDDPSRYELDEIEFVSGFTEDEEVAVQLDARRDFNLGVNPAYVQFGVKLRQRDKNRDVDVTIYEGFDGVWDGLTAADFGGGVDYPLDFFGAGIDRNFRDFFNANRADLGANGYDSAVASHVEDYEAEEDIFASYVMGSIDLGALRLIGGVRVEQTDFSAVASRVYILEEGGVLPAFVDSSFSFLATDDDIFDVFDAGEDVAYLGQGFADQEYTDVLPSLTMRYDYNDNLVFRGAYYRAVARPKFSAIVPAAEIEQDDNGEIKGEIGNPTIDRQVADNFDAAVEWYLGNNGLLSAGIFHKDIDDFIAEVVFEDVDYFGLTFEKAETSINLPDASLTGLELSYQQALTMLPEPFDGLVIGANLTLLDGEAQMFLDDGVSTRTIGLPKLSETLGNLVLGYDKGPIDLRLTLSYRDDYLDELGTQASTDRYVDSHTQLDFSARYRVTDQIRLYAEVSNITDEPFTAYSVTDGGVRVLQQYEEYGYTASFGLKFKY